MYVVQSRFNEYDPRWYCCCGNIHVRTGTTIIAWMIAIGHSLGSLVWIAAVCFAMINEGELWLIMKHQQIVRNDPGSLFARFTDEEFILLIKSVVWMYMITTLVMVLASVCLLVGVTQKNYRLFTPWIIAHIIIGVVKLLTINVVEFAIAIWFSWVVHRCADYMKEREQAGVRNGTVPMMSVPQPYIPRQTHLLYPQYVSTSQQNLRKTYETEALRKIASSSQLHPRVGH